MTDFVVFYSLTGTSRQTAQCLSKALNAELVEIVEERPKKPGIVGFIQGIFDSLRKRRPAIKNTPEVAPADRVILCGPIWAGRIAGPIRTWLHLHGKTVGQLVWVPHSGGSRNWPKAVAEITELTGHAPTRVAAFTSSDFARSEAETKARELAATLKTPRPGPGRKKSG
jgi:hypothetical protein